MKKSLARRVVPKTTTYIVLGALSFLILLPFAWMLLSSVKTNQQLFTIPIKWWVWPLHLDNYTHALSLIPFWSQLGNTIFLSVTTVIGTVLSCSFVAYGLARVDGASELRIYATIILPVSRPVIAAVAVLAFVQAWTDYLGPLIYLNKPSQ
jgi:multiple sugar transport system permease protein